MYTDEQPIISQFARQSPTNFRKVATFVLCTIRMPLLDAADDTPKAWAGEPCRSMFGHKHGAFAYLERHGDDLWYELEYLYTLGASENAMLRVISQVPGIGLAKGGFILQLCYGVSGCLDSHNLERFQIKESRYKKKLAKGRLEEYNDLCARLGGPAYLWDTWCEYLAARDGRYLSAREVSRLHLTPTTI
jgi:hypothetical protein